MAGAIRLTTYFLKEKVEEYARSKFADIPGTFIEQKVQDGTAGAVTLRPATLAPAASLTMISIGSACLAI